MSETISCPACGSANEAGRKFCGECGTALAADVSVMWNAECAVGEVLRGVRYGARRNQPHRRRSLPEQARPRPNAASSPSSSRISSASRRRRSSATPRTRASFSRATSTRRGRIIERYGGTVEKFIGDAVMAVWGTPIATGGRCRARRARRARPGRRRVRAGRRGRRARSFARAPASSPGRPPSRSAPRARAWSPATSSTPRRASSPPPSPGTVLVGEATRRATEPTIAYEEAGAHELKGKDGAVPSSGGRYASSAGLRGSLKSQGLEAPFVGRDRELRLDQGALPRLRGRAQGAAGLDHRHRRHRQVAARRGSSTSTSTDSRTTVYWHRGRCLSYGEGVAYWALAEMVRMRCRIAEDEEPASALAKLHATLEEHVLDAEERRFVEPRLAHLLGLRGPGAGDQRGPLRRLAPLLRAPRGELSDGARLRGHAVGRREPARLRRVPARVVAEPPDLRAHARAAGAAGAPADLGRRAAQLHVALPRAALAAGDGGAPRQGSCPGLPDGGSRRGSSLAPKASRCTRSRPCGCCSTAACSCRTAPRTGSTGEVEALEVPGDAARASSRLDSMACPPEERRLLQDAAVLGKTFTRDALGRRSQGSEADLEPLLVAARAQGGPRRAGRPPLARARPVRLPPGPRPPRRLRDAVEAGAACPASRSRRPPERRVRRGRGRGRRSHRFPLPRRQRSRPGCG